MGGSARQRKGHIRTCQHALVSGGTVGDRSPAPASRHGAHMKAEPASPGGVPLAGRSILIIEDHDDAREALRALLELEGHSVEAAASGPRGVELAQANMPDIALVDIG